jgi:hypothetical protein
MPAHEDMMSSKLLPALNRFALVLVAGAAMATGCI